MNDKCVQKPSCKHHTLQLSKFINYNAWKIEPQAFHGERFVQAERSSYDWPHQLWSVQREREREGASQFCLVSCLHRLLMILRHFYFQHIPNILLIDSLSLRLL